LHMVAAWWFDDSDDLSNSAKLSEFFAVKPHYVWPPAQCHLLESSLDGPSTTE